MNTAILLSGSNMGDRLQNLLTAKQLLPEAGCMLMNESSVYISEPWGNKDQDSFLNQVWSIATQKDPHDLLVSLLAIENTMGRRRNVKWEPRVIDIDILLFNDRVVQSEDLVIPHPHLHERKFALTPLAEIFPQWVHPVLHKTMISLLWEVNDPLTVTKFHSE